KVSIEQNSQPVVQIAEMVKAGIKPMSHVLSRKGDTSRLTDEVNDRDQAAPDHLDTWNRTGTFKEIARGGRSIYVGYVAPGLVDPVPRGSHQGRILVSLKRADAPLEVMWMQEIILCERFDDVTGGVLQAQIVVREQPLPLLVGVAVDPAVLAGILVHDRTGLVGRIVVDDNQLVVLEALGEDAFDGLTP